MSSPAAAPSNLFDKHLTNLANCGQNLVYIYAFLIFLEMGMLIPLSAARIVSPVDSWKGLFYNMWYGMLVFAMMRAFKDMLEPLLLADLARRNGDGKQEASTYFVVDKDGVQIKRVESDSTNRTWSAVACTVLREYIQQDKTKEQDQQTSTHDEDATTPASATEDEIKQDTASASSSARSSADTSDGLNQQSGRGF